MAYQTFVVLLLVVADCLSFNESRRVIYDHFDGDDHLGYFIKTAKEEKDQERTRQNAVGRQGKKIEYKSGPERDELTAKGIVTSLDPREGNLEDFSVESIKNDSALPLHVTSTARQECLDGYQADENGTCQKMLAPKGEKSFKLRRRKREQQQQQQPRLSYADVLKFGRNRPLTIPFKAEILTTTPKAPEVRASTIITTIKPVPSEAVGVTTPTAATGKIAEAGTTAGNLGGVPTTTPVKKDEPVVTTPPVVKATVNEAVTTVPQTAASGVSTSVTPVGKAGVTTVSSAAPISGATTVTSSVNKAGVTTVPPTAKPAAAAPSPAPTKPSGLMIPTILTKIPTRVKSFFGDINKAFLSGEKQSIAAEAAQPNIAPAAKSPEPTRLRRWIHMI